MDIPYTVTARPDTGLYNAKIGIWLFLASEVMLFGGLFSAYIFLRVGADYPWPVHDLDVTLGFWNTIVLIASSVTVLMALASLKLRRFGQYKLYMAITVICAGVFMVNKSMEYTTKFHHYAVKLTDGTILTGHLPEGYQVKFDGVTSLDLTISGGNRAVDADPVDAVLSHIEGDVPKFKFPSGEEKELDASTFGELRKNARAEALKGMKEERKKRIEAAEKALADAPTDWDRHEAEKKLQYAKNYNSLADTKVKLVPVTPLKIAVKPSEVFGYTDTAITFRDGTIATGKLTDDRMTLEVDGVDTRGVSGRPEDSHKSLAFDQRYLGEAWKTDFIAQRDHHIHKFETDHPTRDKAKSATLQKESLYYKIHSAVPPAPGAEHGDKHGAEAHAPADSHGHGEAHHPTVVLEKKDFTFFSNFTPKLNTYYAIYFTLTGLHGLHVVAGALVLLYFLVFNGRMMREDPVHLANRVEVGGLFWHFVDLVWIFLFPLLYLL